jgi:hypothetical protein
MAKLLKNGAVIIGNIPNDEIMMRLEAHRKIEPNANWSIEL